jgi:hypothetical protein
MPLRQSVKELIIQQYMLHEGENLHSSIQPEGKPVKMIPKAHTPLDIYKCLHQGEFGVEHSVSDPGNFRSQLRNELNGVKPGTEEPILENVSLDGNVMRINLRPYLSIFDNNFKQGCNLLTEVCLQSADCPRGNSEHFLSALNEFRYLNQHEELIAGNLVFRFPTASVDQFLLSVKDLTHRLGEVPVFSHSGIYRQINSPAYRVIDLSVFQKSPLASMVEQYNERVFC